ncbi:MAG: aminopeptidase, partial [Crocinitomicaceae bacterium]|nr:aminopeptidase [Crocinitomicaceae bacterium]
MKKYLLVLSLVLQTIFLNAQSSPYFFTTIKDNAKGSVSDQCATSTCWSFATISFLESEIIRKGNPAVNLSEMINVRVLYPQKAESYVRYQGKQQFGPGGLGHDVINVVRDFGVVPERAYTGLEAGKVRHNHSGLDALLEGTVKTVVDKK